MNGSTTHIPAEKLTKVLQILLGHLSKNDNGEVILERDAFWSIPPDSAYDVYREPQELTIGTVSDSWHNLEAIIDDENRAVGYGLVWLSEVLRVIGDESSS